MQRAIRVGIALLFALQILPRTIAADDVPRRDKPLEIEIMLTDGGLLGSFHLEQVKANDPTAPSLPGFYFMHYVWDGAHLQIHPGEVDKNEWSKEAIAKDGWYVTADYSASPPRVIVTKEPTKDSDWQFVPATKEEGVGNYYIKNESDHKKDIWLRLEEDKTKRYSRVDESVADARGAHQYRYWAGTVYKAVLSDEKKEAFSVTDVEQDDGK